MTDSPTRASAGPNSKPIGSSKEFCVSPDSSVAKQLMFGRFDQHQLMPYPEQIANASAAGDSMIAKAKRFCGKYLFPDRIDQHAMLPPGIVKGMGNIGVSGMTVDKKLGGTDMTVFNFCRVMEIIGGHCGSTAAMVRLQNCVVLKLLQNFGTVGQQEKWMNPIIAGQKTGALVITEELAGLDIANIHTAAKANPSGDGFLLSGEKRWIANGVHADVLIVLARTPDDYSPAGQVSAFVIPADQKGVTITPSTAKKLGLRGLSIASIELDNVPVFCDDLIGQQGDAIAMVESIATLDRVSYAASMLGVMKFLLHTMVERSRTRTQFGKSIGQFQQVKQKIANVASNVYALQSAVYFVAAQFEYDNFDPDEVALEAQMLKLFASQSAWSAVNGAMDIWGGKGLFNDQPLERMLRNVRHQLIAEGSNDLLKQTIAAAAFEPSDRKTSMDKTSAATFAEPNKLAWLKSAGGNLPTSPTIEVKHEYLRFHARWLSGHIGKLGRICRTSPESGTDDSCRRDRIADLATNLFVCSCVFSKLSALMVNGTVAEPEKRFAFDTGALYLQAAKAKNLKLMDQLKINLDQAQAGVADRWLEHDFKDANWPLRYDEKTDT